MKSRVLLTITLLTFSSSAMGITYTWTDDQGTMNFTEDKGNIPKKYRKGAKILGEEESEPVAEPVVPRKKEGAPPVAEKGEEKKTEAADISKTMYGGKVGSAWRSELGRANSDVKAAEDQLAQLQGRLRDVSGMSRSEYLSIQTTVKNVELNVQQQRSRRDALVRAADAAGVPAELR